MLKGNKKNENIVLDINVSYICNLRCKFCMTKDLRERQRTFFSFSKIVSNLDKVLNSVKEKYCINKIVIIGGEPSILPYIFNLVKFLKKFVSNVGINTNGLKLADVNFVQKLKESGITFVNMSISHYRNEVIDFLCSVKGTGKRQKQALRNLKYFNIPTVLNCVIQQKNYNDLDKYFLYFYKKYGIKSVGFNFIQLEGYALENLNLVKVNYSDINFRRYVKFFKYFKNKDPNIVVTFNEVPFCVANVRINDYLEFFIDNDYTTRGLISYRQSFDNLRFELQSDIRKFVKVKDDYCKNCVVNEKCEGFWRRNYEILKNDIFYLRNK